MIRSKQFDHPSAQHSDVAALEDLPSCDLTSENTFDVANDGFDTVCRQSCYASGNTVYESAYPQQIGPHQARQTQELEHSVAQLTEYLAYFGIGSARDFKKASEGRIGNNYFAQTNDGRQIIIRIYNLSKGRALGYQIERFLFEVDALLFFQHRRAKGLLQTLQTPALLPTIDGSGRHYRIDHHATDGDANFIVVYDAIPGNTLDRDDLGVDKADSAGKGLYHLLQVAVDYYPGDHTQPGGISYISGILSTLMQRSPGLAQDPTILQMAKYIADVPRRTAIENTPKGIVHGDYFFENTLWAQNGSLHGIIDFGDCFYGEVLHDIAVGAMEFSMRNDEVFDTDACAAFLTHFASWFKKHSIDSDLFIHVLLCNCVRYAVHLMTIGLDDGLPEHSVVDIDYNPYLHRFGFFQHPATHSSIANTFPN